MHVAIWTGSSFLYYIRRDRDLFETKTVNRQARTRGIFCFTHGFSHTLFKISNAWAYCSFSNLPSFNCFQSVVYFIHLYYLPIFLSQAWALKSSLANMPVIDIIMSPKVVHILIPRTYKHVTSSGIKVSAYVIIQRILKWSIILYYWGNSVWSLGP